MMAAYPYFKLFHLLCLIVWLGSIPIQAMLLHIVATETDPERRKRAALFLGKVSKFQVRPALVVALIAGVGMLHTSLIDLMVFPWMTIKLVAVAVLVAAELFVVQPGLARLARIHTDGTADSDLPAKINALAARLKIVFKIYAVGYPGVLFVIMSRGDYNIYLIGAAVFGVAFVVVVRHLLHRVTSEIAKEFPDA